jgi:hypothetical protein
VYANFNSRDFVFLSGLLVVAAGKESSAIIISGYVGYLPSSSGAARSAGRDRTLAHHCVTNSSIGDHRGYRDIN